MELSVSLFVRWVIWHHEGYNGNCVSPMNTHMIKKILPRKFQALTRFSISRKSREEMVSRAGELNVDFSRWSRLSRFWRTNSHSPLEIWDFEVNFSFSSRLNEILQTDSLLESQKIGKKFIFFLSILPSISLPILVRNHVLLFGWIFYQQYFAERESIWQRQLCVVEQYSYFSQQRHFGDMVFSYTQSLFWNWTSELLFVAEIIFSF